MKRLGKVRYRPHCFEHPEGHIFLDCEGPCTITIQGAASMPQSELDEYGRLFASILSTMNDVRIKP
jgi:hypothetical protein